VLAEGVAGELNANLIRLRGSDVFTKWLGESEEAIRETFELARNLAPAVVFLDHLDSLAPRRGGERPEQASQRVLGELLVELDERRAEPIVILAATSAVGLVDPSVIRPGRLGLHLEAGELTDRDRSAIVAGYLDVLAGAALDGAVLAGVVADTAGWSPAELALLTRLAVATTADEPRRAAGDLGRRLNELIDDQMWRWAPVAERE
jgi:transitional endoplasmic reticulum ATPase